MTAHRRPICSLHQPASSSSKLRINLMRLQLTTIYLYSRHIPIIQCTMKPFWDICKGFVAFLSAFQNSRLVRTVEVLVVCVTGELCKEWNIEGALLWLLVVETWIVDAEEFSLSAASADPLILGPSPNVTLASPHPAVGAGFKWRCHLSTVLIW